MKRPGSAGKAVVDITGKAPRPPPPGSEVVSAAACENGGTRKESPETFWTAAAAELCRRVDPRPPPSRPKIGQVDFWRVHCHCLDRLAELLERLLPEGDVGDDGTCLAWRTTNPGDGRAIVVSLFTGAWEDAEAGAAGRDLISLAAHLSGARPIEAARALAEWLGIDPVRRV